MRLYLSGRMTGEPDCGVAAFAAAAATWRAHGFDVVNPAEAFGGRMDLPRSVYLRRDVELLLTCHAILQLPGWEGSAGARLEHAIAAELGMGVMAHLA